MKEIVEYLFFMILRWVAHRLSYSMTEVFGRTLGALTFGIIRFRRTLTLDNLRYAFPELGEGERKSIARGAFKNYGIVLVQMLWADGQSDQTLSETVTVPDRSVFDGSLQKNKGVILLSGHYGGWEHIIHGLRLNLGMPVKIIVQRQRNKRIDSVIDAGRRRHGNETLTMGPGSRGALTALRANEVVAMLGDQSGPKESVFVQFFGRPAATHRGAAAFSLKTGAPIVMTFLVRQSDGSYLAMFEEVDNTGLNEYTESNVVELTRRHTAILEKHIRSHPDHWLWMHRRWKHTQYYAEREALTEGAS